MISIVKILIFILSLSILLSANPKKTITWDIPIEPPITFVKDNKYDGYGISIMKEIQSSLPEYFHKIRVAGNYKRLSRDVKEGPLTCALGLFKTKQRLENMYFTKVPVFSFFDLQIVLTVDLFNKIGQPKELSLKKILKINDFTLGISDGRTYSKKIRDILNENKNNLNISRYAQSNVASSLLQMLVRNRFDYMFLYPDEAMYYSRNIGLSRKIVTIPITEIPDYGHSWAACTKNNTGKDVITKINKSLLKIRRNNDYINYYVAHISSNLHEYYKEHFENIFLKIYED